ncbi:MAG: hypothetical protein HPY55_11865 [Firmicutes bacterium]|nr:hypothetical protein [Bacillota bacterium]
MSREPKRIAAVALAIVLSFAALYAGNLYYGKLTVGDPLERVFKETPSVLSFEIAKRQPVTVVRVTLADVPDLRHVVLSLEEKAAGVLRGQPVRIVVQDTRDQALSAAYYAMHFHIQEALVTGRFSDMSGKVAQVAEGAGLERHRVFIDERNVYVQLHLKGRYLYEVLPRQIGTRSPAGGDM